MKFSEKIGMKNMVEAEDFIDYAAESLLVPDIFIPVARWVTATVVNGIHYFGDFATKLPISLVIKYTYAIMQIEIKL